MKRINKYGLAQLRKDFPNDQKCLQFAFDALHSRECSCGGVYAPVKGRKQFYCSKCRFQIAPLSGTIFHKSDTPLTLWWHALWVFSNAKSGVSAKEMERQLAVTYKTAWRMLSLIRKALKQDGKLLQEYLDAFVFHRNNGDSDKQRFFALLESVLRVGATA